MDLEHFQTAVPDTADPQRFHLYEDPNGRAVVYLDGQAYSAGEWDAVVSDLLPLLGVAVNPIEAENLWIDPAAGDYSAYREESMLDPAQRDEAQRRQRIADLQKELAELTGLSAPEYVDCPVGCLLLAQGVPHTHTANGDGQVLPSIETQINVQRRRG